MTAATLVLPHERGRGAIGMVAFIATEATLFFALLLSYGYLHARGTPPSLGLPALMTLLLITSSVTLHFAKRSPRLGLVLTLLLGASFLIAQSFEYREYLRIVTPKSGAYGSIFYTITGIHGAHVLLGLLLLSYVMLQARVGLLTPSRHLALRIVSWYWHFVDVVWIAIFSILYLAPRL